jgi:hypothetical protein
VDLAHAEGVVQEELSRRGWTEVAKGARRKE